MATNVGLIGLGAMSLGVAKSLRHGGHAVHVCDLRREVTDGFAAVIKIFPGIKLPERKPA